MRRKFINGPYSIHTHTRHNTLVDLFVSCWIKNYHAHNNKFLWAMLEWIIQLFKNSDIVECQPQPCKKENCSNRMRFFFVSFSFVKNKVFLPFVFGLRNTNFRTSIWRPQNLVYLFRLLSLINKATRSSYTCSAWPLFLFSKTIDPIFMEILSSYAMLNRVGPLARFFFNFIFILLDVAHDARKMYQSAPKYTWERIQTQCICWFYVNVTISI